MTERQKRYWTLFDKATMILFKEASKTITQHIQDKQRAKKGQCLKCGAKLGSCAHHLNVVD